MNCAATLASDRINIEDEKFLPDPDCLSVIEYEIDKIDESMPELKCFILPGGNILISYCHIARCVCRRAERAVLRLNEVEKTPEIVYKFLNRVSDYLFVLSRKIGLDLDIEEVKWRV